MVAPVDQTFVSGTTITHEWLNGTNDHVNNKEANPHDQYTLSTDLASSAVGKGVELVGRKFSATGSVESTTAQRLNIEINVWEFLTDAQRDDVTSGAGTLDVTAAVVAATSYANSFLRNGLVSTMKKPGATLVLAGGTYNLATLTTPIQFLCNVRDDGATFVIPSAHAGQAVLVGHTTSGTSFTDSDISVPNVVKPTASTVVVGSIGIRIANITESRIVCKQTYYFESGTWLGGIGEGTAANDIWLAHALYCKRSYVAMPGAGGWFNANRIYGGHVQQSSTYAGGVRASGWRHWLIDGSSPASAIVGNSFYGLVLEGNASEYLVEMKNAYGNTFYTTYHESGAPENAVAVAGDTLTKAAHGLIVGDMVTFQAAVTPTGMFLAVPYYVVSVPTADTFKVSIEKGGAPIVYGSAGTSVTYILCNRMLFDGTAGLCYGNKFFSTFTTSSIAIDYMETGQALGNGNESAFTVTKRNYVPEDVPLFRGVNTASGAGLSRPIYAAYAAAVNPNTDPKNWATALSDRGLAFAASSAEIGLISNVGGVLQYKRPADSVAFEVASCRRAQSLIAITALSCAANAMTYTTITLTGAAVNDHAVVTMSADLPAGLTFSDARVSAANTIRVGFYNHTGSTVSLTINVNAMAVRRFF